MRRTIASLSNRDLVVNVKSTTSSWSPFAYYKYQHRKMMAFFGTDEHYKKWYSENKNETYDSARVYVGLTSAVVCGGLLAKYSIDSGNPKTYDDNCVCGHAVMMASG